MKNFVSLSIIAAAALAAGACSKSEDVAANESTNEAVALDETIDAANVAEPVAENATNAAEANSADANPSVAGDLNSTNSN